MIFVGFEGFQKRSSKERSQELFCSIRPSIIVHVDLAIGSYRHGVSTVVPRMTKVAWHLKRNEIQNSQPNETKKKFVYNISRSG